MQRLYDKKKKYVRTPYYRCNNRKNKYFCDQVENRILDFITENLLLEGYLENYYKELLVNQKKRRTGPNTILKLQNQKKSWQVGFSLMLRFLLVD